MPFALVAANSVARDEVAIAVGHSRYDGGHLGLIIHAAKDGPHVLHLAWHKDVQFNKIPDELKQCWMFHTLDLPSSTAKQVVAFIRAVAAKNPKICYGINFLAANGSFQPNGSYKAPKGSDGLTCASFVVEVLRGASVKLLQLETWDESTANTEWGNRVCDDLGRSGVDPEHIQAVRDNIKGLRLMPFEAAAAVEMGRQAWPVSFNDVQGPAHAVAAQLIAFCPAPRG